MLMRSTHPLVLTASLAMLTAFAGLGHAGFISSASELSRRGDHHGNDDSRDSDSSWLGTLTFPHGLTFSDDSDRDSRDDKDGGRFGDSSDDRDGLHANWHGQHDHDLNDSSTEESLGHDRDGHENSDRCDNPSDGNGNGPPPPPPPPPPPGQNPGPGVISNTPEPSALLLAGIALACAAGVPLRRRLLRS
jgi:hypothetical protein